MRRLIVLAVGLTVILCLTTQTTANSNEQSVEEAADIKNAELNALLAADSSAGVHDNQSGREARQFFGGFRPFFGGGFGGSPFYGGGFGGRPFYGGGFGRRPFYGGFGGRRFRRRRFYRRGGFYG